MSWSRTDVVFSSHGIGCAAWLFLPDHSAATDPVPCVVMAHGFAATRDQGLADFAEAFAAAGYAALVFDYRHFGDSDGEPRQLLLIRRQLEDWRSAIAFARDLPQIDADRIVVWGTSFSGGHAMRLAATDHRLAAAIAQGPFADGLENVLSYGPRQGKSLAGVALKDKIGGWLGRPPYLVPAVGQPGSEAIITTPDGASGFASITPADSPWRNEVSARVGLHVLFYRPRLGARRITCPILFCIARDDVITPPGPVRKAAAAARRSELKEYDGLHFDVYVGPTHEAIVKDEIDFLRRHVPIA